MTGAIMPRCGDCICYVGLPNTNDQGGECHLNPPAVVVTHSQVMTAGGKTQHINTVFPPVPVNSWCARFVPRSAPPGQVLDS